MFTFSAAPSSQQNGSSRSPMGGGGASRATAAPGMGGLFADGVPRLPSQSRQQNIGLLLVDIHCSCVCSKQYIC
jgi:hypothetical protein